MSVIPARDRPTYICAVGLPAGWQGQHRPDGTLMTQQRVVIGFFDDEAEARQAVQLLLANDFDPDHIKLATHTEPNPADGDQPAAPTGADSSSGRFLTSLFGSGDTALANPEAVQRGTILITVQTQSTPEAGKVTELLGTAGATDVTVDGATPEL